MTMEILVHARNLDLDADVEGEARRKAEKLTRLAGDIRRIEVEFSEIRNPREPEPLCCEVTVHLTKNFIKAHAAADVVRTALDRAFHKAHQQLETVHNKRQARTHPR
jgi:ribosomal subunit interface protein